MSTIIERGNKIIDTGYLSDKFGLVEMDITCVEPTPPKETEEYLRKLKNKKNVIHNCNNGEESI